MDFKVGNVKNISPSAIIYSTVARVKPSVHINEYSIIGKKGYGYKKKHKTLIEHRCAIGSHVIIYHGVVIAEGTQVEDFCRIGERTRIGKNCRIIYGSKIYGHVNIGDKCVIGGFICEDVKIGKYCRIFGQLIHKHPLGDLSDLKKWDAGGVPSPIIESNVFIGFGAKIIGGVTIGSGSYILPNAIVTRDVPSNFQVRGVNCQTPLHI